MKILAIIPARSGSKSVAHKNLRVVGGKPLLVHSIEHALASSRVTRTIVSTDNADYAELARGSGAETPFLRPTAISGDNSTDLEVFRHALAWFGKHESYRPDICVHLRPTNPVRNPQQIDRAIDILTRSDDWDSVRTVTEALHPPFKMWHRDENGGLNPVATVDGIAEPWNVPRQSLPCTYIQTANVDVVRSSVILEQRSMTGSRIYGLVESEFNDVDTIQEIKAVDARLRERLHADWLSSDASSRTFCIDIDGVVATRSPGNDYSRSQPCADVITRINELFKLGHRIVMYTARGSETGKDWAEFTRNQLDGWGLKYHELAFGKPAADVYVDDRMVSVSEFVGADAASQTVTPENKK